MTQEDEDIDENRTRSKGVKVEVKKGEETREKLASEDVIRDGLELEVEEGYLYIPVETEFDIGEFDIQGELVERGFERRDTLVSPEDILGYAPSFEMVGDIALIEEEDEEKMREVGESLIKSDNNIETVLNIESKVKGEERLRDLRFVAGENKTETVHREYGNEFLVDLSDVYFSPRLANERQRVISRIDEVERVFDMFAGVGPFSVPAAKRGVEVIAVDVNPDATELLRENARRNGVEDRIQIINADVREVSKGIEDVDRIIMNLPHSSHEFLDSAFEAAGDETVLHYYDIRHEDDLFEGAVEKIREVAEKYGCEIEVLERVNVRSYAPYDYNVCLDVRVKKR